MLFRRLACKQHFLHNSYNTIHDASFLSLVAWSCLPKGSNRRLIPHSTSRSLDNGPLLLTLVVISSLCRRQSRCSSTPHSITYSTQPRHTELDVASASYPARFHQLYGSLSIVAFIPQRQDLIDRQDFRAQ